MGFKNLKTDVEKEDALWYEEEDFENPRPAISEKRQLLADENPLKAGLNPNS